MRRLILPVVLSLIASAAHPEGSLHLGQWPTPTQTTRPWTRWWWPGSGVDAPNLSLMLHQLHDAGLGGVEIIPIYGAKGYEQRFIPYLSPKWMDLFRSTTQTAGSLGMGVDLTTGTGWPMGGPWIPDTQASENVRIQHYSFDADGRLAATIGQSNAPIPRPPAQAGSGAAMDGLVAGAARRGQVICAQAVGPDGTATEVTAKVVEGHLDWTAPGPGWKLYVATGQQPVQKVKRSAPGGEGNVIDPYSIRSLDTYLGRFDTAFRSYRGAPPRAEFHDSFEYFGANWTPDFFGEFLRRRGYNLRTELPALAGDGDPATVARVREDYRRTLAELHREWVAHWTQWSHGHGSLTREQAHGAPANLEDVYAAADIPETEASFGGGGYDQVPMLQFASSAAHVTGRTLASSESFTWLGEHFSVPLSALKPVADTFFLSGINHIFFHGIPYSPSDAPWPGWLFYASVNFGPNGGIFHDLPAFNAYATRCQSILQGGKPDNDVLLYFPVGDFWQRAGTPTEIANRRGRARPDPLVEQFTTPGLWMNGSAFHAAAMELWNSGYSYDEVTDDLLRDAKPAGSGLNLGGNHYRAIVIPNCRVMPLATAELLVRLAQRGVTLLFVGAMPTQVPGLAQFAGQEARLHQLLAGALPPNVRVSEKLTGLMGLRRLMQETGVQPELMTVAGLKFIRRLRPDGTDYFIVNVGGRKVDGWEPIGTRMKSAVLLDPMEPSRSGAASIRHERESDAVYLQLEPGQSIVLRTSQAAAGAGAGWNYLEPASAPGQMLSGAWHVHFIAGGPALPPDFTSPGPAPWTGRSDRDADRFAGTAVYSTEFNYDRALIVAPHCRLDLGKVAESARVRVNGHAVATLWCAPFTTDIGAFLVPGKNALEVEVTNVAANRIADLDRRHVNWKSFYEINFVNRAYEPFDASNWPVRPSGLIGPVTLTALQALSPR